MSLWRKIYYSLLNFNIKLLVRSSAVPDNPIGELNLATTRPILYVLPYDSKADLLTIRKLCLKLNLPDPLKPLLANDPTRPSYLYVSQGPKVFHPHADKTISIDVLHHYLVLHEQDPQIDVQVLPVSVLFGRSPKKGGKHNLPHLKLLNGIQKFFTILWLGRDSIVRFSNPLSLRTISQQYGSTLSMAQKLARVARIHFSRQRLAAVGPQLPTKQELFNRLLQSKAIEKVIEDEVKTKKISRNKAQKNAVNLIKEIAANFSVEAIRIANRVLGWTWNRLYKGINVHNAKRIHQLALEGHELVYVPCHRSHADYLLLSYVLYRQGLVPPHIAAGVNLNFWPIGPIFRRMGAFFIRRSFTGNKLYTTIFREYLGELFARGYSVEYFIEGGRSRTGRLLDPKTGTLTMTIQAVLRGTNRPISIIPVYIGYEHVMEVNTYAKELRGATKEKESLLQILRTLLKLRNLGQCYVNFAEPISLMTYLTQYEPNWRNDIDPIDPQKPNWVPSVVNQLARQIMVNINNAAAINSINLCALILLATRQRALTREQLLKQLTCYLTLMQDAPYHQNVTLPSQTAEEILQYALEMGKFIIDKDNIGDLILLPRKNAVMMTYYRNNIQHLFVIPSLIATIILTYEKCTKKTIHQQIKALYPLLAEELFMYYSMDSLELIIDETIDALTKQQLITNIDQHLNINPPEIVTLQLLAATMRETLQRYTIALSLINHNPNINRGTLEKESRSMAERLSILHGINAPEFFDKEVFSTLVSTLKREDFINDADDTVTEKSRQVYQMVSKLIAPEVSLTIENGTLQLNK